MPTPRAGRGAIALAAGLLVCLGWTTSAGAAPATAELQKRVRSATFEVVTRKVEKDALTYEKPLPLELIPYTERTDKYWSIGTAFAIGPNTFVSAGHVMQAGVGSQFGAPALRDTQGNVYPVDRILKFSAHEDFTVFSVVKPPTVEPFETNVQPAIDDQVYAVGNALGDGVVIRDGLLTSMTPEDQDGRWKWLRFSAAASPGNSGGPLLDASGKVVGIVVMRSEGENLNFALPIDRVLNDDGKQGRIDTRESFTLPILLTSDVAVHKDSFALPLSYPDFTKRVLSSRLSYYTKQRDGMLAAHADELFPRGNAAKLLAAIDRPLEPSVVQQDADRVWQVNGGENKEEADVGDDGHVTVQYLDKAGLFELKFPGTPSDGALYADSRAFMDMLLKGVKLKRPVGQQQIRITSLGVAARDTALVDRFGRKWQLRSWPLGYFDIEMISLALPTPNGYVGLVRVASTSEHDEAVGDLAMLADYFQSPIVGTLKQWQAFMKRKDSQAQFPNLTLAIAPDQPLRFASRRLEVTAPAAWLKDYDEVELTLDTVLMKDGDRVVCDVAKFLLDLDEKGENYIYAKRQAKPASGVGKEIQTRWDDMLNRRGDYARTSFHDDDYKTFWVLGSVGVTPAGATLPDRNAGVLYEIAYHTDKRLLPRELEVRRNELTQAIKVLEH